MLTSSAKNKGRKLQQKVRDILREKYLNEGLVDGDIESIGMGQSGTDIVLSPAAKKIIPYDIECKNVQSFSRNPTIDQAEANSTKDRIPLIIFKKNRSKIYCILSEENFNKTKDFSKHYDIKDITKKSFNIFDALSELDSKKINCLRFYKDDKAYVSLEFNSFIL